MRLSKKLIADLKKNFHAVLNERSEDEIAGLIEKFSEEYYKGNPIISDDLFDQIVAHLKILNPVHPVLKKIGAPVANDNRKEPLPYFMGSLDKIKTDQKVLDKWKVKYTGPYVCSDKLDGNSALLYWKGCDLKLFTRGDGEVGQNISHLLTTLKHIPHFKGPSEVTVRGEIIISKSDFETVSDKGANARNMVAGILNAKKPDMQLAPLAQFVAYEVIHPKMAPSEQFEFLKKNGFKVAFNVSKQDVTLESLSTVLVDRREKSEFEIDGIVVSHDAVHRREKKNPTYAFAFKSVITADKAEVIVTQVEWNMSKDGYMKPTVIFSSVSIGGVSIQRATGFNGKFIKDNVIGPGSKLVITRSGQVIPYIESIITPAESGEPQMPSLDYVWNATGIDIMIKEDNKLDNSELKLKQLEHFVKKLEITGLGPGNIKKMFDAGFKTPLDLFTASARDFLRVEGFKDKSAQKIFDAIQEKKTSSTCLQIMDASNTMGRGLAGRKLQMIIAQFPNILETRYIPQKSELLTIKGIESKTAELFISNLPKFFKFIDDNKLSCVTAKINKPPAPTSTQPPTPSPTQKNTKTETKVNTPPVPVKTVDFTNQIIVFTGFRDKKLEELVTSNGGVVNTSVSKKTTLVVAKDPNESSGKITKAHELGVKVISLEDFKKII